VIARHVFSEQRSQVNVEKFFYPSAPIHMGAALVVLTGILWALFGPGSSHRTVTQAMVDVVDDSSTPTVAYFMAPSFPTECAATDSRDFTFSVVGAAAQLRTLKPGKTGDLTLRVLPGTCEFVDFQPKNYSPTRTAPALSR
jgi:hypothetical protein